MNFTDNSLTGESKLGKMMKVRIRNFSIFYVCPMLSLFLSLCIWISLPRDLGNARLVNGLLLFICILSVGVYGPIGAGWASNSKYSLLGALRSVAQSVSYEVRLSIILISYIL